MIKLSEKILKKYFQRGEGRLWELAKNSIFSPRVILNLKMMMIPKRVMNLLILLLLNYPVYKYVSETETNVVQFGEMNVNYII